MPPSVDARGRRTVRTPLCTPLYNPYADNGIGVLENKYFWWTSFRDNPQFLT